MRPIDADALHEEAVWDCNKGSIDNAEFDFICDYLTAAPTLELERNWIPVEEQLPDMHTSVLVYHRDGEIRKSYRFTDGFVCESLYGDVTHWMPLPFPPAVE